MLWMDQNKRDWYEETAVPGAFETGNMVGDLAMQYFGDFVEVPRELGNVGMIEKTKELIAAGTTVICEASFAFDGNFCSVDILRKVDGGYELIEVKSSTDKEEVKDKETREGTGVFRKKPVKGIDLYDMAYQYYVLTKSGLHVRRVSIMRLHKEYTFKDALDIQKLFVLDDCTELVQKLQAEVADDIDMMKDIAMLDIEPSTLVGTRCDNPFTCGYKKWCWRPEAVPSPNVFDIGFRLHWTRKKKAFAEKLSFADILDAADEMNLNLGQRKQVQAILNPELGPAVEVDEIRQFLDGLEYPVYHLDFETFDQAIPEYDRVQPYQKIPFQYSLHIQSEPGAKPIHKYFLAKEGADPRLALAEALYKDIGSQGTVLAWYMPFERGVLEDLATWFDDPDVYGDMSARFKEIARRKTGRLQDLMIPFEKGHYYRREMGGSYSIKAVLPAILGYDPYAELTLIKHGGDAMDAFPTLHKKPQEEIDEIRQALLAYCELDTQAMVWVLEALYEAVEK